MDRELYISLYMNTILVCFALCAAITAMYTILAPWYKSSAGRQIAGLLGSITLVLGVSAIRIVLGEFPFRMELSLILLWVFTLAVASVGWGIFNAQIRQYRKVRTLKKVTTSKNRSHTMAGENSPEVDNNDSD